MPRKAYKKLYLNTCAQLEQSVHAHADTKHKLKEIEDAIIPFGEAVIENVPLGESPILLDSLQFVSVRAFMEATQRVAFDHLEQAYTWRDRPIVNIGPKQGI
jgi:hypothetical protein